MTEKTGLEALESEVKQTMFGKPGGLSGSDKSMLEMSETNRLVYDAQQSELQIALRLLHTALLATDNRQPVKKKIYDPQAERWITQTVTRDNWPWLQQLDTHVMANQLTIRGYSRSQHLRQNAESSALSVDDEPPGLFARLFGGR